WRRLRTQPCNPFVTQSLEVLVLGLDLVHPVADPVIEVVASRRCAGVDPEVVVLAVPVDGKRAGVEAPRVRTQRRLADGEHAVCGDPDEVRPRAQVVD